MQKYNQCVNAMNKPGGITESRIKRGNLLRGRGEGKTYTKRLGKHEHRLVAEEKLGRPLRKPANKKSSPKWDLLQENLAEGGEKEVQHK